MGHQASLLSQQHIMPTQYNLIQSDLVTAKTHSTEKIPSSYPTFVKSIYFLHVRISKQTIYMYCIISSMLLYRGSTVFLSSVPLQRFQRIQAVPTNSFAAVTVH